MAATAAMCRPPQTSPALDALLAFKINDMHPFSVSPDDLAIVAAEQAHAVATMLGSAFGELDEMSGTNMALQRRGYDAIATLIALSVFASNGGESA